MRATGIQWTPEKEEELISLAEAGQTQAAIAKHFKLNHRQSIARKIRELIDEGRLEARTAAFDEDGYIERALLAGGFSVLQTAPKRALTSAAWYR